MLAKKLSIIICALAAAVSANGAVAQITTANVTGGRVEGVTADGMTSFQGIPYAAPPVGPLRWRDPQPVVSWNGVKRADKLGAACMQDGSVALGTMGSPISEDCLFLNVWTPAKSQADRLPVMVWFHGGGFFSGAGGFYYDGAPIAREGVVVVNLNYRLGPFGFLAHPELSRESGHGSGNYGMLDQIAALKWVKANIAAFGGDPDNVTIFGQSAGGISVSMLTQSPLAKGLFAKVIGMAGASFRGARETDGVNLLAAPPSLARAEIDGAALLARTGAKNVAQARALSAGEIMQAFLPVMMDMRLRPNFDGYVMTGNGYSLYERGAFNDTPVLLGYNEDEGELFSHYGHSQTGFEVKVRATFGAHADAILAAYPHATPAEDLQAMRDLQRDVLFGWPEWSWAKLHTAKSRNKAFVYYFRHRTPQLPRGATHGTEVLMLFDQELPAWDVYWPRDAATGQQLRRYWTNFAKTGDPNGPGLPAWPSFDRKAPRVLEIAPTQAAPYPDLQKLRALDGYYADQRAEAARGREAQ